MKYRQDKTEDRRAVWGTTVVIATLIIIIGMVLSKCDAIEIDDQTIFFARSDITFFTPRNKMRKAASDGTTLFKKTLATKSGTIVIPAFTDFYLSGRSKIFGSENAVFLFDMKEISHDLEIDEKKLPQRLKTLRINGAGEIRGFSVEDGEMRDIEIRGLLFKTSNYNYTMRNAYSFAGDALYSVGPGVTVIADEMPVIQFINGIEISFVKDADDANYVLDASTLMVAGHQIRLSHWKLQTKNGHFLVTRKKYNESVLVECITFTRSIDRIFNYIKDGKKVELSTESTEHSNLEKEIAELFMKK